MDFTATGLLEGLEGEELAARRELLERLSDDGFSLDELRAAVKENRLALLEVERVLGSRYSAADIERRTGVPAELTLRIWRMMGLPQAGPDDRVFGEEDFAAAESTKLFLDAGLGRERIEEITRVLGESMARIAAATAAGFADAFLEPGDSELDVAVRFSSLATRLAPAFHSVLVAAYDSHLRENIRRGVINRRDRESGVFAGEEEMTVCFADLVGFTSLGAEVDARELGVAAGRLAGLAGEVTEPPVRLVKTIGDAAMFVSPEPAPLVAAALSLVDAVQEADLPSLRAGVATGPTLVRVGDFYGHAVNLASRVTGIARADSVLCTQEVRDAAPDQFEWSYAGRHRLKGIGEAVPLHRARPLEEARPARGEWPQSGKRGATRRRAGRPRKRGSS
jgi:adenylate cyclase